MKWFDTVEHMKLNELRKTDGFVDATLVQVARVLESATFLRVRENARGFLMFVVGKTLLGCEGEIKEVTIAMHVFDKPADYDCGGNSVVRVAAENLRAKLIQYYREEGQNDAIEISIPTGTYVPEIRDRRITIALSSIENWNLDKELDQLCITLRDELIFRLRRCGAVQATTLSSPEAKSQGYRYELRGCLICRDEQFRLNVSASDLSSLEIIFAETFDGRRDDLLKVCREIAEAIVGSVRDSARILLRRQIHVVGHHKGRGVIVKTPSPARRN